MGDCGTQPIFLVVEQDTPWGKEETLNLWTTYAAAEDWMENENQVRPVAHGQTRKVVEWYPNVAKYTQPVPEDDPTNPQPNDGMVSWAVRWQRMNEPFGINEMGRVIR